MAPGQSAPAPDHRPKMLLEPMEISTFATYVLLWLQRGGPLPHRAAANRRLFFANLDIPIALATFLSPSDRAALVLFVWVGTEKLRRLHGVVTSRRRASSSESPRD